MKTAYWLLLVIIIAAVFRLSNITSIPPGFYPDEAMYANNAIEAWDTKTFKVFYPENNGREGLWINLISPFIAFFGHEPWVSRSVAAVFGILTVIGLYFLSKALFWEEKVALLSSFFMATSFWHILFSRIGFRAILAPFFFTWALYFLLLGINKLKETPRSKKIFLFSILGGLFYGLGFHTYIAYRATPLLILIIFIYFFLQTKKLALEKEFLKIAVLFSFAAFIVFLPLGLYFLNNPADFFGRTSEISIFNSQNPVASLIVNIFKTAAMFNFAGDFNWRHNYSGAPELFWPVGILFLLGVALCLKRIKSGDFPSLFLLGSLSITALPVIISNEGVPHALRAIIMAPMVFMISGFGGLWLYQYLLPRIKNLLPLTYLFFVLLIAQAYITYFILWAKNPNTAYAFNADYVEIGRKINALDKYKLKIVVVNAPGVIVRGIPVPAQTVMFITDTFEESKRRAKNLHYLTPEDLKRTAIPNLAAVFYLD